MYLSKLRDQLTIYFNQSELRNLCFDLNINHEEIAGETLGDSARELVAYCRRHGMIDVLVHRCCELRPHAVWLQKDLMRK